MNRYWIASLFLLSGCGADTGARPAVEVRTVERVVEVQRPCSATVPARPAPLAKPLPTDAIALSALLGAKLLEVMGPGGTLDRYEAALKLCTKVTP